MKILLAAVALPLALGACAATDEGMAERPVSEPAARVVGQPQSCLRLVEIRESEVRDDWTIDFFTHGGRVYRNTLPNRCPGLAVEDAFTYTTSLTQLCDLEIIYPLDTTGGGLGRRGGCGLGKFVPVELINP